MFFWVFENYGVRAGWRGWVLSKTDGFRSASSRPITHNGAKRAGEGLLRFKMVTHNLFVCWINLELVGDLGYKRPFPPAPLVAVLLVAL